MLILGGSNGIRTRDRKKKFPLCQVKNECIVSALGGRYESAVHTIQVQLQFSQHEAKYLIRVFVEHRTR